MKKENKIMKEFIHEFKIYLKEKRKKYSDYEIHGTLEIYVDKKGD